MQETLPHAEAGTDVPELDILNNSRTLSDTLQRVCSESGMTPKEIWDAFEQIIRADQLRNPELRLRSSIDTAHNNAARCFNLTPTGAREIYDEVKGLCGR